MLENRCTDCGEVKPLSEFYKKKGGWMGRASQCKECARAYAAQFRKERPEEARERVRRSRQFTSS